MNEQDRNEHTVSLSPWINEYSTSGPIINESDHSAKGTNKQSNMAEIYRKCQEEILRKLEMSTDKLGRSMKWKAEAIREDLAEKKDNTYTQEFAKEVIALAEKYL